MIATVRLRVHGVVQGVGFRPFVWRLANALGLVGWVRNDADGVEIAVAGPAPAIDALRERLRREAPPRARVDAVCDLPAAERLSLDAQRGFVILDSATGASPTTAIGPDTAVCDDCLRELLDPANRRYRYAFTTCTHCGPRYTIARSLPYDRARTSLAPFVLCPACAREYADPADRRFHAEATCCPDCGPQLALRDATGQLLAGDPLAATIDRLLAGEIVAIKGLGGFHLACDARNAEAVARLRARKQREEKPFAVMFASAAAIATDIAAGGTVDAVAAALLAAPERPVVLLAKQDGADAMFSGVAPGLAWLGVMLPYTPIHHLLFHEATGRGAAPLALVMTSANPGGEPLVVGNDEALARLAGIADAFLLHDRAIVARADDSVLRALPAALPAPPAPPPRRNPLDIVAVEATAGAAGFQFLRRGRGYTPQAIRLALPAGRAAPAVLAFGGWFKNTVCVTRGDEAFLSAHVGDLDNAATCAYLDETVVRLLDLLAVRPDLVAHDRHPDFYATRAAQAFAALRGLPAIAVQHHHAHIAAVCAEHGVAGPLLGLALDGVGLGDDGGAWGGELLLVDGARCDRLGHLHPLPLPGGDRAAREPWRMGAAALHALGRGAEIAGRYADQPGAPTIATMLARGVNAPPTSSAGRLFDAAAGLLGVQPTMAFEGQAAMRLEGLAAAYEQAHGPVPPLAGGWLIAASGLDLRPLLAHLADTAPAAGDGAAADRERGRLAALFHATLAAALAEWAIAAARAQRLSTIAAAGGCLLNHLLAQELRAHLSAAGVRLLEARRAPPNDGGLALGQAWVAMHSEI